MLKKITSVMLLICILISIIPGNIVLAAQSGTCGKNLKWRLNNSGVLHISGTGDMSDYRHTDAPWQGLPINKVIIEPGVTSISGEAFSDDSGSFGSYHISEVVFKEPCRVKTIGEYAFWEAGVEAITLPSSLIEIGDYAFSSAKLKQIYIPKNIHRLGDAVFYGCSELESIEVSADSIYYKSVDGVLYNKKQTELICYPPKKEGTAFVVPQSVIAIYGAAFMNCASLQNVTMPTYLSSMGPDAFRNCSSLKEIEVPYGVTILDDWCFYGCPALNKITLPITVKYIEYDVFENGAVPLNIFYKGNEEMWEKTEALYGGSTNYNLHYNSNITYNNSYTESDYNPPEAILNGTVYFNSGNGMASFDYDDNYFAKSAYSYNHNLARTSIRLALSAFSAEGLSTQGANVEKLLNDTNFNDVQLNSWYSVSPEVGSIAVAAGNKRIAYEDGNYTLIAVAVRGGNYKSEWGGNFQVGDGTHHEGFASARDKVIEFINGYIYTYNITGHIKLWITGYSRAAATTNLTAAYLDENPDALGDEVSLTPENIYAYCMEAPAGVVKPDNASGLYNNIFSIVNPNDPVPMVAMRKWGFNRYGVTKYLPSTLSYSKKAYNKLEAQVASRFKEYNGNDYVVNEFQNYDLLRWSQPQSLFLEGAIDKVAAGVGSAAKYTQQLQAGMEYVGAEIMGKGNTEELLSSLEKELKARGLYIVKNGVTAWTTKHTLSGINSMSIAMQQAVIAALDNVGVELPKEAITTLAKVLIMLGPADVLTLIGNLSSIAQAHEPTLCMAWLDIIEENHFKNINRRKVRINCPVDVNVYDESNTLVASIIDNEIVDYAENSIIADIDENGQKTIYLPREENYRLEVIATADGEVTYSVQEENPESGEVKITNFNNIPVTKADSISASAPSIADNEAADYTLTHNGAAVEGEIIEAAQTYKIDVRMTGNGSAVGGGYFYKGEFVQLSAAPADMEEFTGWYKNGQLLSKDLDLRMQVDSDATIQARFTTNTCEVQIKDGDTAIDTVRVMKNQATAIDNIYYKPLHVFQGLYKNYQFSTKLGASTSFTRDTAVYAKFAPCEAAGKNYGIYDITHQEGIFKGTLYLNGSVESQEGVLIIAFYDDNGHLTDLKLQGITTAAGENEINVPVENEDYLSYKIMVWKDPKTMDNILEEL